MRIFTLEFEKPILELEQTLNELQKQAAEQKIDLTAQIKAIEDKLEATKKEIFTNLTPWQRVQLARHPRRGTPHRRGHRREPARNDGAEDASARRHPRRRRLRRRSRHRRVRPRADSGKRLLLGDLARGLRGNPVEGPRQRISGRGSAEADRQRPARTR